MSQSIIKLLYLQSKLLILHFLIMDQFLLQLPNLTEAAMLSNSSYNITALTFPSTVGNGTNVTIVVFIVDFVQNVSLTENAIAVHVPEPPPSGVTYTFGNLRGVIPSSKCATIICTQCFYCSRSYEYSLVFSCVCYLYVSCDLPLVWNV